MVTDFEFGLIFDEVAIGIRIGTSDLGLGSDQDGVDSMRWLRWKLHGCSMGSGIVEASWLFMVGSYS
ncbi:putative lectin-like protein kinase [Sesbania bispinosa]|nr:putative lectin-like protein kinase [Sesbania bispinosa]